MLFLNTFLRQYYLIVLKLDLGLDPQNFWTLKSQVCKDCQLRFDGFSRFYLDLLLLKTIILGSQPRTWQMRIYSER